ncbi:ThuA domain-containing protein [Halococcus agarilyticus]|uniref:ThuA domain-containing protein n=1 Tax=Halococcus agarilyticus TaxID=1232219 RepID=UPI0006776697|nr:ThuA domain-containing protein [Halococcus agarilyticus]
MNDTAPVRALVIGEDAFEFHRFGAKYPLLRAFLVADGIALDGTTDRAALADLAGYDVVVDYLTDPTMTDAEREGLLGFVRDGGGYVGIHCAADHETFADQPADHFEELVGGAFVDHPEPCDLDVRVVDADHPITEGVDPAFTIHDEPYEVRWDESVRVLARMAHPELGDLPVAWTKPYGDGSVFYCSLGHTNAAFAHPAVQRLLTRGIRWAADT